MTPLLSNFRGCIWDIFHLVPIVNITKYIMDISICVNHIINSSRVGGRLRVPTFSKYMEGGGGKVLCIFSQHSGTNPVVVTRD